MKPLTSVLRPKIRGFTLPELLVAGTVSLAMAAGMFTAVSALQRTATASMHHTRSQIQQARLLDYMARDLRAALTVNVDTFQGAERLNMTLPDYYDSAGTPRDPVITGGTVSYGNPGSSVPVQYYRQGDKVYRSANGHATLLAADLSSFAIDFTDDGKQAVTISISFIPRYQFKGTTDATLREGTAVYATTLLRNKRK
jgi:hypothetical protein